MLLPPIAAVSSLGASQASASESDEMDADEEEIETGFDELEYNDKEDPESDI